MPGASVPSRRHSAMRRQRAQASTSKHAKAERSAPCMTSEMPGAANFIATCWKPHTADSRTISAIAVASSGRRASI